MHIGKTGFRLRQSYFRILAIIILCSLGFVVYSNTLQNQFCFDDYGSIVENLSIKEPFDLSAIWQFWPTRFITYLSFALDYHYHRLNVFGYHLVNIIIHLSAAIFVWWFVLLTLSTPAMKESAIAARANLIAFFAGLVFVAHPIQTEAVTYIVQRATSLTAFFYLVSLCFYVKSRIIQYEKYTPGLRISYYTASLIAAVMAMFTKEMAITLPLAILLYEFCFFKAGDVINWRYIAPFFIIVLLIPLTMFFTASVDFGSMRRVTEAPSGISIGNYFLTEIRVMVTYLRLLFVPIGQNLDYDYPIVKTPLGLPVYLSLALLILIVSSAFLLLRKKRLIAFTSFWFFLTLLPESSIIPIRDVIFEHRLYLPMAGYSFFIVSIIYYIFGKKSTKAMVLILILLIHWYALLGYTRNFDWRDDLALWDDTVKKSPYKARPYNNRGVAYSRRGDLGRAIIDFNKAIANNPDYAAAYTNRGNAYASKGNFTQAFTDFERALQIDPAYAEAYYNRAVACFLRREYLKSWQDVRKAQDLGYKINPEFLAALKKEPGKGR